MVNRGINFDIELTTDGTKNLLGGLDTASSRWRTLFDAAVTLDTKPLLGLDGGTFYADLQYADGLNASDKLVGDIQGIDGVDGVPGAPHQDRTQIYQLWYQQIAFNGAARIKVGKIDANADFDHSDIAWEFLHQSTGSSATLFTLPTYPDPAFGLDLIIQPNPDFQLGFGVYDGSLANGVRTGQLGLHPLLHRDGGAFVIGEIDQSWKLKRDDLAGRIALGGWYSTKPFERLDGNGTVAGTGGPYAVLEQAIWRANPRSSQDPRGVNFFLMYGYADPAILRYDHNLGGGLSWTGPIPGRPDDMVGLGAQAVHFSEDFKPRDEYEVSYELFYRMQLRPWFYIKPDLQYVVSPGGQGTPDALALTIRFHVDF